MTGFFERMGQRALGTEPRLVVRRGSRYEPKGPTTQWSPPRHAMSSNPPTAKPADVAADAAAGTPGEETTRLVDTLAAMPTATQVTAPVDVSDGTVPAEAPADAVAPTTPADEPEIAGHGRTRGVTTRTSGGKTPSLGDVLLDGTVLTPPPSDSVGTTGDAGTEGRKDAEPDPGEMPGVTRVSSGGAETRRIFDAGRSPGESVAPAEASVQGLDALAFEGVRTSPRSLGPDLSLPLSSA
ncbi:hypothetical protein ACWD4D_38420, partial [Streptomyces bobili]